ncbi:MAG: MBL fold metallo-hydrolase [Chitinivibrionales bacterium]|nr:MBL fold metallo-hydrolase [Chitinivibrionales bacterium]
MPAIEVTSNVYWIGVNDRTTDLFEGLWPITPEGVSYNSYLIKDEKPALIDLTKAMKSDDYFAQIAEVISLSEIKYVVINHVEPDHTGVVRVLRQLAPDTTIVCTPRAVKLLEAFYDITENIQVVADGETLSLGTTTLHFHHIPFVHWPETMATYDESSKVVFTCDAFGGYGALRGNIFDDQNADIDFYEKESLRYFSNIVAKYHASVTKAIDKLSAIDIGIIAPSHGLIWRDRPQRILELYRTWSAYGKTGGELGITIIYGTLYGNTEAIMNAIGMGISSKNVPFEIHDVSREHGSYMLNSLWKNRGVLIGAPTYEGGIFPPLGDIVRLAGSKSMRNKIAGIFGSYGWQTNGPSKELGPIFEANKWSLADTLLINGGATGDELKQAEAFGKKFADAVIAGGKQSA